MIAPKLRASILQAAMQGKLTQQLPGDGDARELLEQIEFSVRPKKHVKTSKNKDNSLIIVSNPPYAIPQNWVWIKLKDVGEIVGGGTPKTTVRDYWEDPTIPWITPADLGSNEDKYVSSGRRNINTKALANSSTRLLPKGSIVFSSRAPIGYVRITLNELCTNQGFKSIVPFKQDMSEFIYYYLLSYRNEIQKLGSGTTFKEVSGAVMREIPFPLPPLSEQKRIVRYLESFSPELEQLEKKEVKLFELQVSFPRKIKTSILQSALQGKLTKQLTEDGDARDLLDQIQQEKAQLVKQGKIKKERDLPPITSDEIPFDIPKNWVWTRLGSVSQINPRNCIDDEMEVSFIPMALLEGAFSNSFSYDARKWKDIKSGFSHFQEDDIIVAKITPCFQNRKSAIMTGLLNKYGAGTTELHVFRVNKKWILHSFLLYFLKSEYVISTGVASMTGTAGQQRVGKVFFENLPFPLPPITEQERIVLKLDEIFKNITYFEGDSS